MSAGLHPTAAPKCARVHQTAQQICDEAGISRRMFFQGQKVRRDGCAELWALIVSGDVPMSLALAVAQFDHASQRLILAEFPTIKSRKRAEFLELVKLAHAQELANGERA
ncbi:hypothetical protein [Polaromonas sp.]|uniref:hypothetical protein n=1 Tax=Polaromonas sp. TaxID=1869339 RepID=UPI00286BE091|nr:hypothetical protein [Polaromonas sp.]